MRASHVQPPSGTYVYTVAYEERGKEVSFY
jgi:hypothetical protein